MTCSKGYSQVEGLDFDETFAPIARLESIRILLTYATRHSFKLCQMDVKSALLNGPIKEEVYVEQPPSFESKEYHNYASKHQEHGMNAFGIFSLKMILGLIRRIPHSSLEKWVKICLYAKYTLIILSLVLLRNTFVMSLAKS
jgi:hypothetical protein